VRVTLAVAAVVAARVWVGAAVVAGGGVGLLHAAAMIVMTTVHTTVRVIHLGKGRLLCMEVLRSTNECHFNAN
jgi:hypothetical protein